MSTVEQDVEDRNKYIEEVMSDVTKVLNVDKGTEDALRFLLEDAYNRGYFAGVDQMKSVALETFDKVLSK